MTVAVSNGPQTSWSAEMTKLLLDIFVYTAVCLFILCVSVLLLMRGFIYIILTTRTEHMWSRHEVQALPHEHHCTM